MKDTTSAHLSLQNLISCYIETNPAEALKNWADKNWKVESYEDIDEACLKYIALVVLDAIESRAEKIVREKAAGGAQARSIRFLPRINACRGKVLRRKAWRSAQEFQPRHQNGIELTMKKRTAHNQRSAL
jgi:hypothetical protein